MTEKKIPLPNSWALEWTKIPLKASRDYTFFSVSNIPASVLKDSDGLSFTSFIFDCHRLSTPIHCSPLRFYVLYTVAQFFGS